VDGYNIIGYINKQEGRNLDLADARDCLINDLAVLRGATGWWIEVVFDAYNVHGPSKTESIDSLMVTYTSSAETADNHIERRFSELKQSGFTNMIVATDDSALQMIAGSTGNGFISSSMLLEELRIAYRGWETTAVELEREVKRVAPTIGDSLSLDVKNAIEELKRQQKQRNQK
jgi:predicted RNA-binding protein with PIN domain